MKAWVRRNVADVKVRWNRWRCWYLDFACSLLPGPLGWKIRRWTYRGRASFGAGVGIDELVRIDYPERLTVGAGSFIGRCSMIQASGTVTIGRQVLIGPYVKIWSADHRFDGAGPICDQGHEFGPVVIGDGSWIGAGVIVLKGISIGERAVIGAGAVVTKDVPPGATAVGNPARVLSKGGDG